MVQRQGMEITALGPGDLRAAAEFLQQSSGAATGVEHLQGAPPPVGFPLQSLQQTSPQGPIPPVPLLQGRHHLVFPRLHQLTPPAWNAPSRRGSNPSQTLSTSFLGR